MANIGVSSVKIHDNDGDIVTVTSNRLDVNAYLSAGSVNVGDVDILSIIPGTGATNLGKAEDASHSSGDVGVMALAVSGTLVSRVGSNGDYAPLQVHSLGGLYITGSEVEDSAVQGTPLLIGGRYDSSSRTLDSGDAGAVALNASGNVLVEVTNFLGGTGTAKVVGAGAEDGAVSGNPLLIAGRYDAGARTLDDGDVGTIAVTNKGYVHVNFTTGLTGVHDEDHGHSNGDAGVFSLAIRNDTLAALAGSDGDYSGFQVNNLGALYVTGGEVENAAVQSQPMLAGGRYDSSARTLGDGDAGAIALTAKGEVLVNLNTTSVLLSREDVAHTSGDYGVMSMTVRSDTPGSLGSDGDYTPLITDVRGALYTKHRILGGADGVTTVSSAGTDVVLKSDTSCVKIDIQAQTDNTGLIAVGFTGVDATEATGTGIILYAGDTYSLEVNNTNLIYIDATVSGEGVRYTYYN